MRITRTGKYPRQRANEGVGYPHMIHKAEEVLEDTKTEFFPVDGVFQLLNLNGFDIESESALRKLCEEGRIENIKDGDDYKISRAAILKIFDI